jgi:hypothetical protein
LEDAKLDLRAAWERFYDALSADDIAAWHKNDELTQVQAKEKWER